MSFRNGLSAGFRDRFRAAFRAGFRDGFRAAFRAGFRKLGPNVVIFSQILGRKICGNFLPQRKFGLWGAMFYFDQQYLIR